MDKKPLLSESEIKLMTQLLRKTYFIAKCLIYYKDQLDGI